MPSRHTWAIAALAIAVAALYLFHLDSVGVLGPDEPRYAAIGRAMAQTGDWITPRLWGSPWFEKPPLLYWMTAVGTKLGLNPDLCGRLPVVLLSLAFLVAAGSIVKSEYGALTGAVASVLLGTSAGWLAFSSLCLTDVPMSACFALAMLLVLRLLGNDVRQPSLEFAAIGGLLGLAMLAKGLVPIALALPALWFLRRQWRYWPIALVTLLLVAGPWYGLVYARNGLPFVQEFFLKHHLERLYSASLQHVQPFYYYGPVLLGALFPWTPLFFISSGWRSGWDQRRRFLLATVLFGLVFFSISRNKLPGYLLPLLPLCFVLLASGLQAFRRSWLVAPAILIAMVPLLAPVLPQSLMLGRINWVGFTSLSRSEWLYVALPLLVVALARRPWLPLLLVLSLIANGLWLKAAVYPQLDLFVSPRMLWNLTGSLSRDTCDAGTNRDWLLGLTYYRGSAYPPCDNSKGYRYALKSVGRARPQLIPLTRL